MLMWEVNFLTSQVPSLSLSQWSFIQIKVYDGDGELLSLLKYYLKNREQKVVFNGQTSEWIKIKSWVLQGSVLGPLLFLFQ